MLWDRLVATAAAYPDKVAIAAPDGTLTYRELVGAASVNLDARVGDRVCWLGFNAAAMLVTVFQCARQGLIFAPMNWRLAPAELCDIVELADPAILIADAHHGAIADDVAGGRPVRAAGDVRLTGGLMADIGARVEDGDADRPLLLMFTSGATGRAKGVVLSDRAVLSHADLSVDMHGLTADDHVMTVLPMFHVGGLNIQTVPALLTGAQVTLMDRFEPAQCLATISDVRPTLTVHVPASIQALTSEPTWPDADLGSLRAVATGSTDVPLAAIDAFLSRGIEVLQVYGATETAPIAIYQRTGDTSVPPGSIGRAGAEVDVRLVDPNGNDVPVGTSGEVLVRSPALADGYWQGPGQLLLRDAFPDGWFRSGDVALVDPDGRYWFTDRLKNVIISGGENIYPTELTRVIEQVPGVDEVAVVGLPDARWGTVPVAAVVGTAAETTIRNALLSALARFKQPREIIFLDSLPRNAMGKVVPERLRDHLLDALARA